MKTYEVVIMEENQKFKKVVWVHRSFWESMRTTVHAALKYAKEEGERQGKQMAVLSIHRID